MQLEKLNKYFDALNKYGWVINYVIDGRKRNIHTSGLINKYGHLELQIVLPIKPSLVKNIIWGMVRMIENGKRFEHGKCYFNIPYVHRVKICKTSSDDMLRVILPDNDGYLHYNCMKDEVFKNQYNDL